MAIAILVAILGLAFTVFICTVGIVNQIREVHVRQDVVIDLMQKERTANARQRIER